MLTISLVDCRCSDSERAAAVRRARGAILSACGGSERAAERLYIRSQAIFARVEQWPAPAGSVSPEEERDYERWEDIDRRAMRAAERGWARGMPDPAHLEYQVVEDLR